MESIKIGIHKYTFRIKAMDYPNKYNGNRYICDLLDYGLIIATSYGRTEHEAREQMNQVIKDMS